MLLELISKEGIANTLRVLDQVAVLLDHVSNGLPHQSICSAENAIISCSMGAHSFGYSFVSKNAAAVQAVRMGNRRTVYCRTLL